jgi:hypothetical protein
MSAGAESFRLFLALPIPAEVKASLSTAQDELRQLLPARTASWTRAENMHLTLRFLGDVDGQRVEALIASVRSATAGFGALPLVSELLGAFPDLRYPRVTSRWHGSNRSSARRRRSSRPSSTTPLIVGLVNGPVSILNSSAANCRRTAAVIRVWRNFRCDHPLILQNRRGKSWVPIRRRPL